MIKLILASSSERRKLLLQQIGINNFDVIPPDIDESILKGEQPRQYALRMAVEKAQKVYNENQDSMVIAADTVVSVGDKVLPKAEDEDTFKKCMNILSGRRHRVYGGICIIDKNATYKKVIKTSVAFKVLSKTEIDWYLKSGLWKGKAGGYGIQDMASGFVRSINGSYTNVVGLDLFSVANKLRTGNIL